MKKVLFTATIDGHIKAFHIPYLKYFKDNGYEVHVATNGDGEIPYCDVKHKICIERSPLKINNLKAIKQLKNIIDKEKFEIIHCHTPMGSVVTRIAAKNARKNGTRVIYTAHGFHFFSGAPLVNWMVYYPVEKYLSKYTDTIITINKEDYERAKSKFKKCKDIQYVPGVGIDEEKFNFELSADDKHKLRQSFGIKDDDFLIIYVAELSKRKNQSMAIKAMESLVKDNKNVKLLLVGKDSYNGIYQQLVKELNLDDNVIFAGFRKDVPQLMKMSDLAISTSRQEGLPVNIMEAMFCKLPIIATNCRGNRDLVNDDSTISINDIDGMVNKIQKQIKNNYDCYKNNDYEKYGLNKIIKIMDKIYTEKKI